MGIVIADLGISLDGFMAAPNQSLESPFGDGGQRLIDWMLNDENRSNFDQPEVGAHVMGRNMFGPGRGEWDLAWKGWWGDEPPYHAPVYVLTHHAREALPMEGGTTFHFVTDGLESALKQAREAAGDKNVAIAGGASVVRQYLAAGLIDELTLHIAPVTLGQGERPLDGVAGLNLRQIAVIAKPDMTHVRYQITR